VTSWRGAAVIVAVAALLPACTNGQQPEAPATPSPTATTAPSPSEIAEPSPSPTDPFAVPTEITPEYVERVLNEINRLDAELTKQILRTPVDPDATELPEGAAERLESLYANSILEINRNTLLDLLRSPERREAVREPDSYGQLMSEVEQVLLANESCIIARVQTDFSETDAVPDTTSTLTFEFLVRAETNATRWQVARSLGADIEAGSPEEDELRELGVADLAEDRQEVCP
jgi:hypothetical protein